MPYPQITLDEEDQRELEAAALRAMASAGADVDALPEGPQPVVTPLVEPVGEPPKPLPVKPQPVATPLMEPRGEPPREVPQPVASVPQQPKVAQRSIPAESGAARSAPVEPAAALSAPRQAPAQPPAAADSPERAALRALQSPTESDADAMRRLMDEADRRGIGGRISGALVGLLSPQQAFQQQAERRAAQRNEALMRFRDLKAQQATSLQTQREDARLARQAESQRAATEESRRRFDEQMGLRREQMESQDALRREQMASQEPLIQARIDQLRRSNATNEEKLDPASPISRQAQRALQEIYVNLRMPVPEDLDQMTAYQAEEYLNQHLQSAGRLKQKDRGAGMGGGPTTAQRVAGTDALRDSVYNMMVSAGEDPERAREMVAGAPRKVLEDAYKKYVSGSIDESRSRGAETRRHVVDLSRRMESVSNMDSAANEALRSWQAVSPAELRNLALKTSGGDFVIPDSGISPEGRLALQNFNKLRAVILKERSGAAVSEAEFQRVTNELGMSFTTPADVIRALQRVTSDTSRWGREVRAGYSEDVVKQFAANRAREDEAAAQATMPAASRETVTVKINGQPRQLMRDKLDAARRIAQQRGDTFEVMQ